MLFISDFLMLQKFLTHSPKESFNLGKKFARQLKKGAVLGLIGELGSGKTQFVKGLANGLGVKNVINSPTFVILKNYRLPITDYGLRYFIHVDCYRLNDPWELLALGLAEYLKLGNNIIAIEWAKQVKNILPKDTIWLNFKSRGDTERLITVQFPKNK